MTKQECAVIEAYTGICILQGKDRKFYYQYLKHLFGRPIFTHEIPKLMDEIKEKSKQDFKAICANAFDIESVCEGLLEFLDLDDNDDTSDDCEVDISDEDSEDFIKFLSDLMGIPECERFTNEEFDTVNRPEHYQSKSGIEVIDVIEAFTDGLDGIEAVCQGNLLKYACRWPKKNGLEDLKKAEWYLKKLIAEVENG